MSNGKETTMNELEAWADALASPEVTSQLIMGDLWARMSEEDHRWLAIVQYGISWCDEHQGYHATIAQAVQDANAIVPAYSR
jgi:hypothetical protein